MYNIFSVGQISFIDQKVVIYHGTLYKFYLVFFKKIKNQLYL